MLAAQRIPKPEERRAVDGERKEDEQDHGCAERDLSVAAAAAVVFLLIGFVLHAVHLPGPEGGFWSEKVLFSRFISSIGSGKTMVVFFSTPISVSVCR